MDGKTHYHSAESKIEEEVHNELERRDIKRQVQSQCVIRRGKEIKVVPFKQKTTRQLSLPEARAKVMAFMKDKLKDDKEATILNDLPLDQVVRHYRECGVI